MTFVLPEDHPLASGYHLQSCATCSTVFANVPRNLDLRRHYAEGSIYADASLSSGSARDPYDTARLDDTAALLTRWMPALRDQPIIDIGTGGGGLLDALRTHGWTHTIGLDPSSACVTAVKQRGHRGQEASFGMPWPNLPTAGCVTLVHVLEHVVDPAAALRQAASLLRPGGHLYVEVPDAARYHEAITAPFQDINTEHLNHFSGPGLALLLRRSGLRVTAHGNRNFPISATATCPATWAIATPGSDAHPDMTPDAGLETGMSTYLARSQSLLDHYERHLQGILTSVGPEGLSIWGCGQLLMRLLAETCLGAAPIACLVDGNPVLQGRRLRGLVIQSPEALTDHPQPVLITAAIHAKAIQQRLEVDLGLKRRIVLLDHPT